MNLIRFLPICFLVLPLSATITASLAPSLPSPQPVGTTITWTPTASDTNAGTLQYRYAVAPSGSTTFQTLLDFDTAMLFPWTPYTHEGSYTVQLTVKNSSTHQTQTVTAPFTFTPLTTAAGGAPVITASANPLVALYSGPGCATGSQFRVRFLTGALVYHTATVACSPTLTNNVYVAGMLPSTKYEMNYQIVTGTNVTNGPELSFTTGVVDTSLVFPPLSVVLNESANPQQQMLLIDPIPGTPPANYIPYATDLNGNILWYYANVATTDPTNIIPVTGGTMMLFTANPNAIQLGQQLFREIDLAGNTIRETSVPRLSQQLTSAGKLGITELNHDALRLANGHTLVIASQEELFPAGTQPSLEPGSVDILGDAILDLDTNMQIAWFWSAFDFLDINRPATLGEVCVQADRNIGCPPLYLAPIANDWLHSNSLTMDKDGNIILSSRNQDFVFKINYAGGTGNGSVMWTLGLGGSFAITGISDPYPWFSHQHDVKFEPGTSSDLTVYDNGNLRISEDGGFSRGQVLALDETALTANLFVNDNMGVFSHALGTSQLLDNGEYHFLSGWIVDGTSYSAQSVEVNPSGVFDYQMNIGTNVYRTYQMSTLYSVQ